MAATGTGLLVAAATPAAASGCADGAGVTVVVDYRSLGGGVQVGCAAGSPASGLDALQAAGFGYNSASRQPGFVCRIGGRPATDPCVNAAPASAYWSYWHAQPGGAWAFSDLGAAGYTPAAGSVEGWSFGSGQQPGIAAPARPAPPPPPAQPPAQPDLAAPNPGQQSPGQGNQPRPTPPAATQQGGRTTASAGAPTAGQDSASADPSTTGSSAETPGSSTAATSSPATTPTAGATPAGHGGLVGLLVGIAVIAGLGGLAWWTARRRAKATP
ncbi:hypothetical protein F0L68_38465 [Solihabitans fulvus]|uniref:Uncharacterized protein n=1 Tax=Solihabitans fulvus TaxID=1892852 RepID=A0A5B2WHY3_9PSEU|nr:hypothetical protein F0L68_38465 [Solihabitans fulvus]